MGTNCLPRVWIGSVQPEKYPGFEARQVKPVTRGDLGNVFHTTALRAFRYDRAPGPRGFRLVKVGETLDLYTETYDFGRVVWPAWQFLFAENWKEVVDEIRARGLYLFDIWAYCPSGPFEKFEWSEYRVPEDKHRYIIETLGPRFLGYDNGEQDGRYIGGYAKRVCPAPTDRRRAHQHFCQYFRQLGDDLQNYLIALCSLTFPHYFARMGNHRMLGAETAQALPSIPMWYAFIRGAGKQHGLLWYGNASVFNRWGWKVMEDPSAEDERSGHYLRGPTAGASMSLLNRLWIVLVMYGSVMMSFEQGHLIERKGREPLLTEIGKKQLELKKWCDDHPSRGELHTPVALLLDLYAGWVPPRHLYTKDTYLVWGNMPYEKGDHQVDLLLRELYPGYEDASFYHDERGFLTPTPCGDSFDVLLSDASDEILSHYECVILLGGLKLEGDLLVKIERFLDKGGNLVVCANQLGEGGSRLLGVEVGDIREDYHAGIPGMTWPVNEPEFRFHLLGLPSGSEILSSTKRGEPLAAMVERQEGGSALVFASEFFLSNEVTPPETIHNEIDQPLASPFSMLQHAKAILLPHLRSYNLIEVHGPPIQYLVNVDSRTNRLLVTLCNNTPQTWQGYVEPKRVRIMGAVSWMTGNGLRAQNPLRIEVPPLDTVTVELILSGPAFEARE